MQSDPKRNRFLAIYLTSLALVGIGLIAAGAVLGLGGWTYGLGGLLLVAGGGGGITMLATGGAGKVSCPRCVFENEQPSQGGSVYATVRVTGPKG